MSTYFVKAAPGYALAIFDENRNFGICHKAVYDRPIRVFMVMKTGRGTNNELEQPVSNIIYKS